MKYIPYWAKNLHYKLKHIYYSHKCTIRGTIKSEKTSKFKILTKVFGNSNLDFHLHILCLHK